MAVDELSNVIGRLSHATRDNTSNLLADNRQRRNYVAEDFDKEYTTNGDPDNPGVVYLAMSPDVLYLDRWEFKIIIEPFVVPLAPGASAISPASITLDPTSLTLSKERVKEGEEHTHRVSPNPHTHSVKPNPHTHTVNAGITLSPPTFTKLDFILDGVDLTPYFKAQHSSWVNGLGIFPDLSLENRYNVLKACEFFDAATRNTILQPGYHVVELKSDGLFSAKLREFKKYSFINRH